MPTTKIYILEIDGETRVCGRERERSDWFTCCGERGNWRSYGGEEEADMRSLRCLPKPC